MLSILIPTYNYDCSKLVYALHKQALSAHIPFEIIVIDDCSTKKLLDIQKIQMLTNVTYDTLEENVGRATIRNILADKAKYDYLLFLDSDSYPANDDFLNNYLQYIPQNKIVLGGRVYNAPSDVEHTLLPTYGKAELNTNKPDEPSLTPFITANFLLPKNVFEKIRFNDKFKGYGHEDTIFGIELMRHNYCYYKINNPVIHLEIEDNITFLKKTREAIDNLYSFYYQYNYVELKTLSPLMKMYFRMKRIKMVGLLSFVYRKFGREIEDRLNVEKPSIFLLSIYKIAYICNHSVTN